MSRPALLASLLLAATPVAAQELPPVPLRIEFDPEASERLAAAGEKVVIGAWFYGPPAHKWVATDEMGLATVLMEEITIDPVSQVVLLGEHIGRMTMDWVAKPYLNVNVHSARLSSGGDLLDCGSIDDALGRLRRSEAVIACGLLDY